MKPSSRLRGLRRIASTATAVAAAVLATGCASTGVDATWRDLQLEPGYLRGATVLLRCETPELVLQRLCEDRAATELQARGARVVFTPASLQPPLAPSQLDPQLQQAARDAGAKAVFGVTLGEASRALSPGVSLGLGGFGFGRHAGGGIGVSVPIGGGRVRSGFAASGRITDVGSGRLLWTARAAAAPSSDVNAQINELVKAVIDEARRNGLF